MNRIGGHEVRTLARIEKYTTNGAATKQRALDKVAKYKGSKNPYKWAKGKYWQRKLTKYTGKVGKYARDATKIGRMQLKAGKFGKFGKFAKGFGKVTRGAGTLLNVVTMGFMIFSMVEDARIRGGQDDLEAERKRKYDRAEQLLEDMNKKMEVSYGVGMLSESKTMAENQLNLLINYSSSALEETNILKNVWQNITNDIVGLEDAAKIGLESSQEEQAYQFTNVLESIKDMYARWESIEKSSYHLSNYYYRDEFGNPQDMEIDLLEELENDPELSDEAEDPLEEFIKDLPKLETN